MNIKAQIAPKLWDVETSEESLSQARQELLAKGRLEEFFESIELGNVAILEAAGESLSDKAEALKKNRVGLYDGSTFGGFSTPMNAGFLGFLLGVAVGTFSATGLEIGAWWGATLVAWISSGWARRILEIRRQNKQARLLKSLISTCQSPSKHGFQPISAGAVIDELSRLEQPETREDFKRAAKRLEGYESLAFEVAVEKLCKRARGDVSKALGQMERTIFSSAFEAKR